VVQFSADLDAKGLSFCSGRDNKEKIFVGDNCIMDLKNKSRDELEALKKDVEAAIEDARKRDYEKAREAAAKAAAQFGYSLDELNPKTGKRKSSAASGQPKYRNPDDASQTWTGKGRQPRWFKAAMEKGTDPSKLEI
jgi:DNA-binding protein H-NS